MRHFFEFILACAAVIVFFMVCISMAYMTLAVIVEIWNLLLH